jgi:hypothetical protein
MRQSVTLMARVFGAVAYEVPLSRPHRERQRRVEDGRGDLGRLLYAARWNTQPSTPPARRSEHHDAEVTFGQLQIDAAVAHEAWNSPVTQVPDVGGCVVPSSVGTAVRSPAPCG